ncbi:TlpA disulfide reductase family protein [Maridesulfovibrio ferrireducens]|uniref:TlpA family protein disulfide reductase n=1 Tax=Maridesulfovibrio ferrireducens TaxID=246191 RepID=UPI001A2869DE|nr:TlpA disulfide reductase family protein [Maridesulfovibrio ferrireducens]MBI9112726.1 TlpA family protein disulfide reductase [Maridesulfovibrio ferrireducens]
MRFTNKICVMMAMVLMLAVGCSKAETTGEVKTLNAQAVQDVVAQSKGKVVVLNFWATWCPPCRAEIPELVELRKKFSDDDLMMIGVSVDPDVADVKEFMSKDAQFNYPIYFADSDVGSFFKLESIPRTLVFDTKGKKVFDKSGSFPGSMFEAFINKLLKDR